NIKLPKLRNYLPEFLIFIKDVKCGNIRYGCNHYDYEEGTLIFIAPGQVYGVETNGEPQQAHGKVLLFHPDLIHGTDLGRKIKGYTLRLHKNLP
ncbi:MAG TPA: hypothetical protein VMT63_07455, partial [Bacteroidales bacterium]|nr:hypothetical protein [Bacteroidales bacterium]